MFRLDPVMPVHSYKTYQFSQRPDVLIKVACEQIGCPAWANGWETTVDEATDHGRTAAHYIRTQAGRTFRESRTAAGLTVFRFDSRQRCFAEHKSQPETFGVWGGDWRQNLGTIRRHSRGIDWVEDFAEHQDRIAEQIERG